MIVNEQLKKDYLFWWTSLKETCKTQEEFNLRMLAKREELIRKHSYKGNKPI